MTSKKAFTLAGALVALGVATYLGIAAFMANRELGRHREWRKKMLALKTVVDRELPGLRAAAELQPLTGACAGKLPPQGFSAVLGYFDQGDITDGQHLGRELTAYVPAFNSINIEFMDQAQEAPEFGWKFNEALDPWSWGREWWRADPSVAKYLVLTLPLKIDFPQISEDGKSFSPGTGELRTRVLAMPGGSMICEGTSVPVTPDSVKTDGRGKTKEIAQARASIEMMEKLHRDFANAIKYTPLLEVCAAADQRFCEQMKGNLPR